MATVLVLDYLGRAVASVVDLAALPEVREAAAGDELGVSFNSDSRADMARTAALFLARVAYLDGLDGVPPRGAGWWPGRDDEGDT